MYIIQNRTLYDHIKVKNIYTRIIKYHTNILYLYNHINNYFKLNIISNITELIYFLDILLFFIKKYIFIYIIILIHIL